MSQEFNLQYMSIFEKRFQFNSIATLFDITIYYNDSFWFPSTTKSRHFFNSSLALLIHMSCLPVYHSAECSHLCIFECSILLKTVFKRNREWIILETFRIFSIVVLLIPLQPGCIEENLPRQTRLCPASFKGFFSAGAATDGTATEEYSF